MKKSILVYLSSFCLFFLCAMPVVLQAQQKAVISGKVYSPSNEEIDGISVIVKGSNLGTSTNANGYYQLKNVNQGYITLVFSGLGYLSQEKTIEVNKGAVSLNVTLNEDLKQLKEITVSGAKKFAEKKSDYVARLPIANLENPQVYTVVPKELFQEQISTDFRSALQTVPGLTNITQGVGSGGVGLAIRMRGFSGANAGGAIRNGMATNWVSLSDPVNLEAIEVIKGPSSTLFGGILVSYGGLVNRVTKKPFGYTAGSIDYSTGSFGLSRLTLDVNAPVNEDKSLMLRVNAAYHNEDSFQDYGKNITQVIAPSLKYVINDRLTFDLDLEAFQTKRNTTYIGSVPTNGNVTVKTIDDLNIDFNKSFSTDDYLSESKIFNAFAKASYKISDQWKSETNYSYANTQNQANYLFLKFLTDSTFNRQVMNIPSTFGINQIQQNFIGDFKIGSLRNRLLVGLDYNLLKTNDRRTGQITYDTFNFNKPTPDLSQEKYADILSTATRGTNNRQFETYSAYVSEVLNVTDGFIAMASLRVDRYKSKFDDYKQTAFSPKFGVVYQLVKNKVSLFGNYMNGFSNVSPLAIFGETEKVAAKPEEANQIEGGLKLEILDGKLNGTLSYYDISVKNKVRSDPFNPGFSLQNGTQSSKGFEADLIANPFPGFHIILGYAYNESLYTKGDSSIVNLRPTGTPYHTGNTWISYKFINGQAKGLGFGIGGNYQSDAKFVNVRTKKAGTSFYNETPFTFGVDGFTRFDATVFYEQPKYRLGLKVNNLTDKKYWTAESWAYREPTRQFIFNVSYKF